MTIPDLNPLGYTGLKQLNPPNIHYQASSPTKFDIVGFDIGDIWINTTSPTTGYMLTSKSAGIQNGRQTGIWTQFVIGSGNINSITGANGISAVQTGPIVALNGVYNSSQFSIASNTVNLTGSNPTLPMFIAYLSASNSNKTGDNTSYPLIMDTTIVNRNSMYNTTTGAITFPVAGIYSINVVLNLNGVGAAHNSMLVALSNGGSYQIMRLNPANLADTASSYVNMTGSYVGSFTASASITPYVQISGGTKIIGLNGGSEPGAISYVSGYQIC
jgi:hypothetical protein